MLLEEVSVQCPWCGEPFDTTVDLTAGNSQYVEDCQICCQPIVFTVRVCNGALEELTIAREND
jgi:hypothetical protein